VHIRQSIKNSIIFHGVGKSTIPVHFALKHKIPLNNIHFGNTLSVLCIITEEN